MKKKWKKAEEFFDRINMMMTKIKKAGFIFCLLWTVLPLAWAADDDAPPDELVSPDKASSVKIIEKAMPKVNPDDNPFTLVFTAHGKVLSKFPAQGYFLNAFWSEDNKYVAVNNRRGNAGDYLWVFSVADGHAIKQPNDLDTQPFVDRVNKKFPETQGADFDKSLTVTTGWKSPNELIVSTSMNFEHSRDLYVLTDTYKIENGHLVLEDDQVDKKPGVLPY